MKEKKFDKSITHWSIILGLLVVSCSLFAFNIVVFLRALLNASGDNKGMHLNYTVMIPVTFFLFIILFTVAAFYLSKELHKLTEALRSVADGDFSSTIQYNEKEIFASAYRDFNIMSAELRSNQMLKEDFINNFSHEFKTPIASINGFAKLIQEQQLSKEDSKQYIDIIAEESARLAELSRNTLLLSKLDSEQLVTDKAPYKIDEQIKQCAIILSHQWEPKHINMNLNLPETIYNGNSELLQEVWINIITNAIKFTPQNGTISISIESSALSKKSNELHGQKNCAQNTLSIIISDNGQGMSEEVQQHIFERYYQGDTSHATQGHGLGLAIVKSIICLCGGEIIVTSQINKGTTVTVTLPSI